MKSALRLSLLSLAAIAAVFATGCSKKPLRPNPYQTVVGGQPGGNFGAIPVDIGGAPSGLETRTGDPLDNADFTRFQPVLFAFDSAAIGPAERSKVEEAATYLKANPGARIVLVGRCDWRGTTEYNLGLGDRRARSVLDYLATFGISASQVEVISKGDQDAKEGGTAAEMQQDRRVDIGLFQ